jgi:hypothetical protein
MPTMPSASGGATVEPLRPAARAGTKSTAAALFALAGALFVVYPALRPYTSETGLVGAMAFGSDRWVLAHLAGMFAFGCLATGSCLLTRRTLDRVGTVLGVGLILPYYGAETFGLHAIGRAAVQHGAANLTAVADAVRYHPAAISMFGAGWILLAAAAVAVARVLWTRGIRAGAILIGAGMVLYLPQFFAPPWLRIAHGVVLGVGLAIVSIRLVRSGVGD